MDDFGFKPKGAPADGADLGFKPVASKAKELGFKPLTDVHGYVPSQQEDAYPGNYQEHGQDPAEQTSLGEDVRRVGEAVTNLPQTLGQGAWKLAEAATDLPLRALATRNAQTGNNDAFANVLANQGIKAPQPDTQVEPNLPKDFNPITAGPGSLRGMGNPMLGQIGPPQVDQTLDATMPNLGGVTARQLLNKGVDATIGRTERFGQWLLGRPLSEMMVGASKMAQPYVDELPQIKAMKEMGLLAKNGPGDEYGAKQWLDIAAGPGFTPAEGSPEEQAYHKRTEEMYGSAASTVMKYGVMLGKQWPLVILPGGEGKFASTGEDMLLQSAKEMAPGEMKAALPALEDAARMGPLKSNLAGAAIQSGYMAAANKEDFLNSLEEGTALGGVMGYIHAAWASRQLPKTLSKAVRTPAPDTGGYTSPRPVAVMPPKTMQAFKAELDQYITRASTFKVRKASELEAGNAIVGERMASELGHGEHSFDVQQGDVMHPTFSAPAVDANGMFVMRDYEVIAGPGRAKTTAPKEVTVQTKGQPEAWTKVKKVPATAHSTNVTVRYRDTPIKDTEALARLSTQPGRRIMPNAMDDQTRAIHDTLITNITRANPDMMMEGQGSIFNGEEPVGYMDPATEGKAYLAYKVATGGVTTQQLNELIRPERPVMPADPHAETPVLVAVKKDGRVSMTPVVAPPPRRPNTRDFRPGDFVGIGHPEAGYKTTVEGVTAEGNVLVRNPVGKLEEHPREDVYLSQDMAAERAKLLQWQTATDATAKPEIGANRRVEAIALANKAFTLPDLMRWDKRPVQDLGWAAQTAQDMVDRKLVKETKPGIFEPVKRREAASNDITKDAEGGQLVYYAKGGPTGDGAWGVLRGPDTRTKGNWLIEVPDASRGTVPHPMAGQVFKKTVHISIPEADVRTKWPVLLGDKSKVNPDIDAFGWTKPMPSSFVAQEPADEVRKMREAWSRATSSGLIAKSNKAGEMAWNSIVGAMHQADPLIRTSKAQLGFSAGHTMRSEALSVNRFLEDKLGPSSAANQELALILEQHRTRTPSGVSQGIDQSLLQNWAQKYPKEFVAVNHDLQQMVALLDQQSQTLAQYGIGNIAELEAKRANDQVPEYLTTNYAAFQMPRKQWADFARKNLTQEFANLTEWMQKVRPSRSGSQVVAEIDRILRLENPIKGFEDAGYIKAEGKGKLKAKQDVPLAIRAILGEHKDASMRLSFTLAYQRQLIKSVEAFNAIASHPELFSPGWRADMTLQVPTDQPLFGLAQGGFVNDNAATRQLLEGAKMTSNADSAAFLRAAGWLGQKWKTGHTVYNQASWVANMARNAKGVMLSPWDVTGYSQAAHMLADYGNNPTIYGPNKLLAEAMDYGAVGPGLAGAELGAEQRKFQRKVFATFAKSHGSFMDTLGDLRDHALSVPESIHKGYDSIDKVAKFGSYLNWRREFIGQGMTVDDAAALASLRVNELFPNYSGTADWARNQFGGAKWTVGLAPYATSKLEDIRINGNIAKNLIGALMPAGMKPKYYDDQLAMKVLAMFSVVGGAATLALQTRRMNGISDAQDLLERSQIPIKSQKYSHLLLGSLDYDEHGRRTFYPVDTFEDLGMTLAGNKGDDPLIRSALNNLLDVVGPDSLQGMAATHFAEQAGVVTPEQQPGAPRADQTGLLGAAGKFLPPFLPQAPFKVNAAIQATNPSGRMVNPEALTANQGVMQGLGLSRPMVVGPQTHLQTEMETAHNVNARAADIRSAATDAALSGVSSERQNYMLHSNVRALKKSINIPRPLKSGPTGGTK